MLELDVKIERRPSGAFGSLCDVSGDFHPRLNSSATSWLMKIATSKQTSQRSRLMSLKTT